MRWKFSLLLYILTIELSLMGVSSSNGNLRSRMQVNAYTAGVSTATPIPIATDTPTIIEATAIPPDRILPPVGKNVYLVLGASVLVLIIIGGVVLTSRKRAKH